MLESLFADWSLTNSFRNPEGAGDLIFNHWRMAAMVDCFSTHLSLDGRHLLGCAAVHCALRVLWAREVGKHPADDHHLLPVPQNAVASQPSAPIALRPEKGLRTEQERNQVTHPAGFLPRLSKRAN